MANEIPLTLVGNLTADPEYREHDGREYASFTVASSARVFNRETNTWSDGPTTFMPCNLSGATVAALREQHVAKGRRMIVTGTITTRSWQDRDSGAQRSRIEMRVSDWGLVFLPEIGRSPQPQPQQRSDLRPQYQPQQQDGWTGGYNDEMPF